MSHLVALGVQEERLSGFGTGIAVIANLIGLAAVKSVNVTRGGLREGLLLREHERANEALAPWRGEFLEQYAVLGGWTASS